MVLKELIEENDIDLNDFFIQVSLNKAILDFVKKDKNNISSAEDKEKLKKYFFSDLYSIVSKSKNDNFLSSYIKDTDIKGRNGSFYSYNNYFLKEQEDDIHLMKNEYDFYNKVKEDRNLNEQIGKNINKYYACFDKEINNKKHRIVVSKNLQKGNFKDLEMFSKNNELTGQQAIGIINEVLRIHNTLENKAGLYNFDLKPENVMINKAGDIKLIDYEGMVPEDGTKLLTTYPVEKNEQLSTDKYFRSCYYNYIKFIFIIRFLSKVSNISQMSELNKDCEKMYKLIENKESVVENSQSLSEDFLKNFDSFCFKYTDYFTQQFKLDKKWFEKIRDLINFEIVAVQAERPYKNITIKDEIDEIDSELLNKKLKEKDSIYMINEIVINKSNKLVRAGNNKFIKKRKKGESFNVFNWYHEEKEKNKIKKKKNYLSTIVSENVAEYLNIVDNTIPIDEQDIFQQLVLGTLMVSLMDDYFELRKNPVDLDSYIDKNKKKIAEYVFKNVTKEKFKDTFMEIISIDDKAFLDLFFDFNNECELIQVDESNFKLRFFSSELELDLGYKEASKIREKFQVSAINGNTHFGFKNNKLNFTDIKAEKESEGWFWNKTYITYSISHKNTELLSLPMETKQIIIKNSEKIKNVYLDLDKGCMVYDDENKIYNFYRYNNEFLEEFIQENNINTKDFFIRVSLNKAILDL